MDNRVVGILQGVFIIVIGILLAVCGIDTTINTYFAVVSLVTGIILVAFSLVAVIRKRDFPAISLVVGAVLITIASALFAHRLSFAELVLFLVFVVMGFGFGLIGLGIISLIRRNTVVGAAELIIGALLVLFTSLYISIPAFERAFWVITGIIIIAMGIFVMIAMIKELKFSGFKAK